MLVFKNTIKFAHDLHTNENPILSNNPLEKITQGVPEIDVSRHNEGPQLRPSFKQYHSEVIFEGCQGSLNWSPRCRKAPVIVFFFSLGAQNGFFFTGRPRSLRIKKLPTVAPLKPFGTISSRGFCRGPSTGHPQCRELWDPGTTQTEILLNHAEIRLYSPFSDRFGTKRTSVWLRTNRKMVNTI